MKKYSALLLIAGSLFIHAFSQEEKYLYLKGYVTSMQGVMFDSVRGDFLNENLIHNRLNFKAYTGRHVSIAVEMRNRIFTGDRVRMIPEYDEMIGDDQGWFDLSWNIMNEKSVIINTTVDRYWLDLSFEKLQVRVGRQRINWGQTFVWNPNDIFNAYSYFDFDYIERPGSDAIRLQVYPNYSSTIEMAVKLDSEDDVNAAGLFRFNKWGYDFQFLAGFVNSEDLVIGAGWSGAFGSTSFRGEGSWFQPADNFSDTTGTALFTISFDRSLSNNGMVQIQAMYCNNPIDFDSFESFYDGNLSARDLAFSEFNLFGSISLPLTPLFNLGVSAIWYPGLNGYFAGPSIDWSLSQNVDLSFIWQHFESRPQADNLKINLGFLRFKYSF